MTFEATSVGELVSSLASRGTRGRVKRIFRNSVYLAAREDLVLLMRGELRSPMSVDLVDAPDFSEGFSIDEPFELTAAGLTAGKVEVRFARAPVFRSSLMDGQKTDPIDESAIVKSATALKLLYSASPQRLDFIGGRAFSGFVESVVLPVARGETTKVYSLQSYLGLLGSGPGFTPAGDDLVAGFAAAFNTYANASGRKKISLPLPELRKRTVYESAVLLAYAQRGYVDEVMERLILAGLGNDSRGFRTQLSNLASRGHTSGLDMSLGVLLLVAAVNDLETRGAALRSLVQAIAN